MLHPRSPLESLTSANGVFGAVRQSVAHMKRIAFHALILLGCNVEAIGTATGGIPHDYEGDPPPEGCPRGVTVLMTDFLSTQVALSALDGVTLSSSFLSSASTETDGLSFAFSGDVSLPSEQPLSSRVVLIDRFGTNVISWADPRTAIVLGQLPIATGFESNPYDYIEVSEELAYVARFGTNGQPGQRDFDGGDDVLVIDTQQYEIIGRIPLAEAGDALPARPTRFARIENEILVTLQRASLDFVTLGESELVGLDPERHERTWRHVLTGMRGCGGAVSSPSGRELIVPCSGGISKRGAALDLSSAGLVVLDATVSPPVETARFIIEQLGGEGIQSTLAFASESVVLLKTQTPIDGFTHNRLLAFNRASGEVLELLRARPNSLGRGRGIVFGSLLCRPQCTSYCLLADADRGVVQRLRVKGDQVVLDGAFVVERGVGLPPRDLSYR